ncbi:uncharacterized protein LOC135839077 [Planococcus citri]|uniref:uncharacterized protein LOC135839077 n=1 Tax=Planococcus citri TaxID=170843 RepID=UPI0031F7B43B
MSVKLYGTLFSPPVRSVMHTLRALCIPYEFIEVNLLKSENRSEEFLKLNPQHTVPTIQEGDGFILWESHAINGYLVDKYGKDDELYPKDLKNRAIVNQRLHFNNGILLTCSRRTIMTILREKNVTELTEGMKIQVDSCYDFVETFLTEKQYIAGKYITIADFSILSALNTLNIMAPRNDEKYPLIKDYVKRSETVAGFKELEDIGRQKVVEILKSTNFKIKYMRFTVFYLSTCPLSSSAMKRKQKMSVKLYGALFSPPVRAVMHTLKALSVPYKFIEVDVRKGGTRSEEFLKINPQHTVPTIQDEDGFAIWESHAINAYLADKYGKDDKLYPKDLKARAIVNQRLHFNNGVLLSTFRNTFLTIVLNKNITQLTDQLKAPIENGYSLVEAFLAGKQYIAGNDVTIADFSFLSSLNTLNIIKPQNDAKYPLITDYVKRGETILPEFKEVENQGAQKITEMLKSANFEV